MKSVDSETRQKKLPKHERIAFSRNAKMPEHKKKEFLV